MPYRVTAGALERAIELQTETRKKSATAFERMQRNVQTMLNPTFLMACELAGVPATKRQASKWSNKKGIAYSLRGAAKRELAARLQFAVDWTEAIEMDRAWGEAMTETQRLS